MSARADRLQRALGLVLDRRRAHRRLAHADARTHAHLDAAFHFERDQRLAHRGARDAELHREIALGGNRVPTRELAVLDQRAQLLGDLAIEAAR